MARGKGNSILKRMGFWFGGRRNRSGNRCTGQDSRLTDIYPRLANLGGYTTRERPLIKPTAANLRKFAKTPYARRAINAVKDPVARLKWEIAPKRDVALSSEIARQIEVVTACLRRPNEDDSFRTLVEQVTEDILIGGAGAIEQQVGSDPARPVWLWPVDGLSIQIYAGWSGKPDEARYLQTLGFGNIGGVQGVSLRNDELIYIRKDPSTESPFGYGALEVAFATIDRQLGVADYAGNVAGNAQPENIIFLKGISAEALQTFRGYWRDEIEGQGETPKIGGEEVQVLKLRGANDDALYLKYQTFLLREIATAFGVSPQNLGVEADVNRSTAEVAEDRDWNGAIIPTAELIASHLNRECIEGKLGFSQIEFRWVGLDREDETETARRYEIYYKANAITPNEQRARMGMPPMEGEWGDLTAADVRIAVKAGAWSQTAAGH